jgi:conjugative transfer signal peptidase TraF
MRTHRKQYRDFVIVSSGTLILFTLICSIGSCMGYRINSTPSLPQGIWKIDTLTNPVRRGQVVNIRPADRPIFQMARSRHYLSWGLCTGGYVSLLKPIAAIPGDQVEISGDGIAVNGVLLPNSKGSITDSVGRPLQPVKAGTYFVQPRTVWLVSSNTQSFDSRYFGPMPIENILGTAKPIWIGGPF